MEAWGKRKREGGDSMEALEAAAAAEPLPPAPVSKLSGFVSAGVIQQGNKEQEEENGAACLRCRLS